MLNKFLTRRLTCCKLKDKDIEIITKWNNSQESQGEYLTPENTTLEENQQKFENDNFWNENSKTYLIKIKEDKTPIGTIKYWTKTDNAKTALIAVKIAAPKFRGQGLGTEVQKAMIRELFLKYKFDTVEMYTDINNIPQQKCLQKLDFKNIKTEDYEDSGVTRQGHLYRLTKSRYEQSGVHIYYYE